MAYIVGESDFQAGYSSKTNFCLYAHKRTRNVRFYKRLCLYKLKEFENNCILQFKKIKPINDHANSGSKQISATKENKHSFYFLLEDVLASHI